MMRRFRFPCLLTLMVTLGLSVSPSRADLMPVDGLVGLNGLASFEGSLSYESTTSQSAVLTVVLKNTTSAGIGGYLTAFAFNNPDGSITGASLGGPASFSLLGGPGFANGVTGAPFGQFDLGASTGSSFEGGGPPSNGLGVGQTGTFTFTLTGTGLNLLTASRFLSENSVPPGAGEGVVSFVARFRGLIDGGSDKVPYSPGEPGLTPQQVPEPSTLGLGGLALLSLTGARWLRRKRAS